MLTQRLGLASTFGKQVLIEEITKEFTKTLKEGQSFVIDAITLAENSFNEQAFVFRGRISSKSEGDMIVGKGHLIARVIKNGGQFQPEIFLEFTIDKVKSG